MSHDMGQVYPLFPSDEDAYPVREHKPSRRCDHRQTRFSKASRRLICLKCGEEVDAFDVVLKLAADRERLDQQREHVIRGCRMGEARLAEILRQERNAKARMRRLKEPVDENAIRHAERDVSNPPAPRVGGGAVDPLTVPQAEIKPTDGAA